MSSILYDQMPSSLVKTIKKLSNYRINQIRGTPEGGSTASPTQSVRIRCPTDKIVDWDSFAVHGLYTQGGAASTAIPNIEQFIAQLRVSIGGDNHDTIQYYSDLFQVLHNVNASTAHLSNRYITSFGPKPSYVNVDIALATATDATSEGGASVGTGGGTANQGVIVQRLVPQGLADAGTKYFTMSTWLGLLGSLGIVDMTFLNQMEIELVLHNNNILAPAAATWSFSDLHWTCDVIQFPMYTEALLANLNQGGTLNYEFPRYVNQIFTGASSSTFSHKYSIASSDLQRVWWTYKKSTYATQAALGTGDHVSRYFIYTNTDNEQIQTAKLTIDGTQFPQYDKRIDRYGFYELTRALGKQGDIQWDCCIESQNDYNVRKFVDVFNFAHKASGPGEISGINTMGMSSNVVLDLTCSAALATAGTFLIFNECKAVLNVLPGRVSRVII